MGQTSQVKARFTFIDGQCERVWVRITDVNHENGIYTGVLDNDPLHKAAKCGDLIHFHSLHIAEIYKGRR